MKLIKSEEQRPVDGQTVLFYWAMRDKWIEIEYREDFIYHTRLGLVMIRDCPFWMPKPQLPADYVNDWL